MTIEPIDQYIAEQAAEIQPVLQSIRETIRTAAPEAVEKIAYQMPAFWQGANLIYFAAFKKHISIFPGGEATIVFADRLAGYKTAKGTIQLPLGKPVPYDLIADITRWRVEQAAAKSIDRKSKKYDIPPNSLSVGNPCKVIRRL